MASIFAFSAGQKLTAGALNNAITNVTPLVAVKPSDTSRASNTTLTNDPDLTVTAAANITYLLTGLLFYDPGAGLIKFELSLPAGASRQQLLGGLDTSVTTVSTGIIRMSRNSQALGGGPAGTIVGADFEAVVVMGATPGAVTLQWAQNATSGTATVLKAQSWMMLTPQPQ